MKPKEEVRRVHPEAQSYHSLIFQRWEITDMADFSVLGRGSTAQAAWADAARRLREERENGC